jgi:signal transduction histidine kinase/ligand-binding sensor domain-containing protein/DNA-binding response OmpR family regulator
MLSLSTEIALKNLNHMKRPIKILVCFHLLLLNFNCLFSQTTKLYSTEQGLSNSLINRIYQDKKGFIWVATEDGLNKFDGNKFVVYRKIQGDSTALKNNYVRTLFEDRCENLWIGCIDGLMIYDRNTNLFHEIEIYDGENTRIYPHITSIIERKNGDLWLATSGSGLFSIKKGKKTAKLETQLSESLCSRFLTVVYEDSENRLWIGSENSGLNVYSFHTKKLDAYTVSSKAGKRITNDAISAICEGENGTVFVGTLNGGLNKFETNDMIIRPVYDRNGNKQLPIKTLIFNESKQLFVGTDGYGMKIYNAESEILETYEPISSFPFNFSKVKIHSLLEDKDGNIWAGMFQKGVFFMPGKPNGFKYYGYKSFRKNSIGSNCVMSIYKDKNGIIWVGTDNDGLYAVNEQTQQVRHFENIDHPSSVPNTITCIEESSHGKLWLGSYLNGFVLFDKQTGKCDYINNRSNHKVYCMVDDRKGGLWIGTYGEGLYKFDIASQSLAAHYYQYREGDKGLSNNWINSLVYEEELLWIGTYNGLNCLNTKTNTFRSYEQENLNLSRKIIFSLKKDKCGNIWIGTNEGLACLNKKTEEIKMFTVHDGLSNNVICSIEDDEKGNIWVSTLSGISKYSPKENEFTNYYTSDGLQGNEFSRGAHFKSEDGEIFFGGTNGITGFNPKDIHSKKKKLNVYITDFYLFGTPVYKNQRSGKKEILDQPIINASSISLASGDNVFNFDFSTLEYDNPEGISYRCRLETFDADWVILPQGINRITYTNLSPGKYRFLFQATDKENKSEIKSIEITIRPPWYLTVWAKCIYAVLFLSILYTIYSYIFSRIKQRNEMLRLEHAEQINEAKLQFFINISHEIRTPMTLIMGPLEKLLTENKNETLYNSYLLIYRNAQRILRLINQLMDIRKIDRGQMHLKSRETDMVGFIKDIMQAFEYMAKKKNIAFEFNPSMPVLKVWVDLNNFDKILFNVFSNAFKFTPNNGQITVELTTGIDHSTAGPLKHHFEIRVLDTGIGIDEEKINKIFERFYQINSEITNSNFGTGIGLHLARSLVELQHGIIYAENRTDQTGSCFIIRMPMGNAHLKNDEMEIIPAEAFLETFAYSQKDDLFDVESEPDDIPNVKAKTKYRILIAEDDIEINNYIKTELAPLYKISQTTNGKEALEFVLKEKPDLVISDIMMPEMDGIMLCRKIKSNVNINHIPVLLLTAKSKEEDRAEGLDTGADAYLVKPFNMEILKKTIANLLDNRERLKGLFQSQSEGRIKKIEIKSSDEILMEKIMKIINDNINNPDLTVEMLSASVGMSRVHMHRKLKELTNQSAQNFIRSIRMKLAEELLRSKKLTISEVAYAVGFSSLSHFSSSFKEFFGQSPREYVDNSAKRCETNNL